MSLNRRWLGLALVAVLLAFGAKSFFGKSVQDVAVSEAKVAALPTAKARLVPFDLTCEEPGFLVSDERVVLKTRISGFIAEVLVREGESVQKGQPLVIMDSRSVDAAISQQRASLEASRIAVKDAERDVAYYTPLVQKGAYPRDKLYKLQVRLKSAKADYDQAKAALSASLAEKSYSSIVSPLDCVVLAKHKNAGDMAVPGEALLTLDSTRNLLFRFYLPEQRLKDIGLNSKVILQFAALPGESVHGKIRSIIPAVDAKSRSFEVNVAVEDNPSLVAGMYGRARVILGNSPVLALPNKALVERGGLLGVYVVDETQRVAFRWLRLGRKQGQLTEIMAGLSEGERVVLGGVGLRDGLMLAEKREYGD
ncbi:MAG: efflux RND transporter periplasmic adaptor subunit [Desulfovibrionaceae bacterium]|nr:efflux RND transporter periplasmic adaptor subunit [Desulfovibrionaceae bacterium]